MGLGPKAMCVGLASDQETSSLDFEQTRGVKLNNLVVAK